MKSDKPQIIGSDKGARREEWGRLDLGERDVKPRESERIPSKLREMVCTHQTGRTRHAREL